MITTTSSPFTVWSATGNNIGKTNKRTDQANGSSITPIPEDNTTPLLISASPSTERNLDVTPSTRLETSSAQSLDNSTRAKHQDGGNGDKANNAVNLGWKDSAAEGGSSLKVGDQPESNGNTATSRIPYENGYGDLARKDSCDLLRYDKFLLADSLDV